MKPKTVGAVHGKEIVERPCEILTGLAQGSPVLTMDGELPIEFLSVGDRVITRAGMARVSSIDIKDSSEAPYRICERALGSGRPENDIVVAAGQRVLLRGWRAKALFARDQVMTPVERIADGEYIARISAGSTRFYSLRFDTPQVYYAGGLEVEAAEQERVSAAAS